MQHHGMLRVVILLAVFLPPFCRSLVCYDNVVAEQPVLIGCNFKGGACGITNKTTVTSLNGFNITDYRILYHCADRSSSCSAGPMNFCNAQFESEHVSCVTSCCKSDKCNLPGDAEFKVEQVPESKALSCYQLVGDDQKRVKCMFKGAVCLYMDVGPPDIFKIYGEPQNRTVSQLCTTRKFFNEMKTSCNSGQFDPDSGMNEDICTIKYCNTDFCNPLPWNTHYNGQGPHPNAKAVKPTHTRGVVQKKNQKQPKTDAPRLDDDGLKSVKQPRTEAPFQDKDFSKSKTQPKTETPFQDDSLEDSVLDNTPKTEDSKRHRKTPKQKTEMSYSGYSYSDSKVVWYIIITLLVFILSFAFAVIRYKRRRAATVVYVRMRDT